jgi:hypothetical protein
MIFLLRADFSLHLIDDTSFDILDGEFIRCHYPLRKKTFNKSPTKGDFL